MLVSQDHLDLPLTSSGPGEKNKPLHILVLGEIFAVFQNAFHHRSSKKITGEKTTTLVSLSA